MAKQTSGLSEPAYERLVELIMTKHLMPGDHIPEIKLAEEFKISRTPIRDALRKLSNDGLVEIFPNRFAQVRVYSKKDIREIGTVRIAMDAMAVKLAGLYGSLSNFLSLMDLAEKSIEAAKQGDTDARHKYDSLFHSTLYQIAGNEMLTKFHNELQMRVAFIQLHHPDPTQNELPFMEQHKELAQALMNHDENSASQIIREHLSSFYGLKDEYPTDFFKNNI